MIEFTLILLAFILSFIAGWLWKNIYQDFRIYYPSNQLLKTISHWFKKQLEHSDDKILLLILTFRNKRIQPIQNVWDGGIKKALLDKIKVEPYWGKTDFRWVK